MPRYAIEACRARVTLSAANPATALAWGVRNLRVPADMIRVQPLTDNPPQDGHNTPNSMSSTKTKKPAPKATKKLAPKAPKTTRKPTLGERVENAASKPTQAHKTAPKSEKAMSGLDAAALVLKEASNSMGAKEIVAAIRDRGLASGLKGKTPHATIYAAMITEIGKKGDKSRFRRGEKKGTFECNR